MINTRRAWHRTHIQEDTNIRLEDGSESVEEPSMRVDFLLVLLFEAEDDLDGDYAFFCAFDFHGGGYAYLGCVFVDVGCHGFAVDDVLAKVISKM